MPPPPRFRLWIGFAAIAAGFAFFFALGAWRDQRKQLSAAEEANDQMRAQIRDLERRLKEEVRRGIDADNDNSTLLAALSKAKEPGAAAAKAKVSPAKFLERWKRALAAVESRQFEAALPDILWCLDEGVHVYGYGGVRSSLVVNKLAEIAKISPVAMKALLERRENARRDFTLDPSDKQALNDFVMYNRALETPQVTLHMYDSLPPGDPRKPTLASGIFDELAALGRYDDALVGNPYEKTVTIFDLHARSLQKSDADAGQKALRRAQMVESAASNINVLVKAGKRAQAEEFAARVIQFHNTTETRAAINKALGAPAR